MPQIGRAPACPQRDRNRIGLVITLFFGLAFGTSAQAADSLRPNVLLIYTDDQGYGDGSCLNSESKVITPHLDRLAREGMVFTDAHCSDTVCTPSRYGLLTGRYSWRTELKRGVFGATARRALNSMTLVRIQRRATTWPPPIQMW